MMERPSSPQGISNSRFGGKRSWAVPVSASRPRGALSRVRSRAVTAGTSRPPRSMTSSARPVPPAAGRSTQSRCRSTQAVRSVIRSMAQLSRQLPISSAAGAAGWAWVGWAWAAIGAISRTARRIAARNMARMIGAGAGEGEMAAARPPAVTLADGTSVPALGQGTWHMGERGADRRARGGGAAARARSRHDADRHRRDVRRGRRRGGGRRGDRRPARRGVPASARSIRTTPRGAAAVAACERSLRRLRTDRLDLYLLHWRGSRAAGRDGGGVRALRQAGKIRRLGRQQLRRRRHGGAAGVPAAGDCATNQVLYNLARRGHRVGPAALVPRSGGCR